MITKIKILLAKPMHHEHEQSDTGTVDEGLDSFVKDIESSGNKTRPRIEEHAMIAKIVKMLRGDDENSKIPPGLAEHDKDMCDCEDCKESGIMNKLMKRFYG